MVHKKICNRNFPSTTVVFLVLLVTLISGCGRQSTPTPIPQTSSATPAQNATPKTLPDLIITDAILVIEQSDICDPQNSQIWIQVLVNNYGEIDAGPFLVRMNDEQQVVSGGLQADQQMILRFSGFSPQVTVLVDPSSTIDESDETNNQVLFNFDLPTIAPECIVTPSPEIIRQGSIVALEGHTSSVKSLDFSPDGDLIASGSNDNTLRLWRVDDTSLLRTMGGHPFPVLAVKFTPNGANLATSSSDGLVRLWQVSNGRLNNTLRGHAGRVNKLDISSDGKFLASCGEDFTVRLWRLSDGWLMETIDEGMAAINDLTFSPNGQVLAWGEVDGTLRQRTMSGEWLTITRDVSKPITSLSYSIEGDWLAVGYADGEIRIVQTTNGKLVKTLKAHSSTVSALVFSPDSHWLISSSHDKTIRLWSLETIQTLPYPSLIYYGHTGPVNSIAVSPNGRLFASGGDDYTIHLWSLPED